MASFFQDARLPQQRVVEGVAFPAVLVPSAPASVATGDVDEFPAAVRSERASRLEPLVRDAGALLLREFPARTTSDFDGAVGYEELPYVGAAAPVTNVVGRVFTANESPPADQKIPFHHEMAQAQVPTFLSKLFFFCEVEPKSGCGGETPMVLSHYVYSRMKEKLPEFVEKSEKDGLIYTRVLGEGDDPSSPTDKAVAEERAAKLGMKLEWE
uniref:TauD/TfdA-like domain-containing protein n=1 Tax=Setaria viridis TaxID=4556 RepID=A0A4U6UGH2_SETVI|nr:hypothetical protein SEVIR_5G139500v2 [Setaria viridis]